MMEHVTKERLLEKGWSLLLLHGYNHLGIQELLDVTAVPKGSFYHHFRSKEDFALQVVDRYMAVAHGALDTFLDDPAVPPLRRVRNFFEGIREMYRAEGFMGCLLGSLGQELAGVSETFRRKIDACFQAIAARIAGCLEEAIQRGDLSQDTDPQRMANLLVNCWEGAALRTRLQRDPAPLQAMLDFYFPIAAR